MAAVVLENVSKSFGKVDVIRQVYIHIKDGEFVVFVGPSGCGKSTLLRLIAGLEELTTGEVFIDDVNVSHLPPSQRDIAMVFQSYALYPHMTVAENMGFGLKLKHFPADEIKSCRSNNCWNVNPRHCPVVNASVLPSAALLSPNPRYSCSTNPCQTWTPPCG